MATPDIRKLDFSDSDPEEFLKSPSRTSTATNLPNRQAENVQRNGESRYDSEQAREAALQKELDGVRTINEVIEGVIASLDSANGNMDSVSRTVNSASTLLNTWTRILSQTEHNQRLILNKNWQGASQDVVDMENETVLKAQAAERRAAEEERRREEARRRAEDEERQRQAGTAVRGTRGSRSRGRGTGRGGTTGSGYGQSGSSAGGRGIPQSSGRSSTSLGRGLGGTRGRARGVR
ncbi:DASH complex subunit Duo1 [Phlyctema vagabunda]|uniref:DASH complex subunit DUO1 n=1 Tax=Phlyctema vagabunda TaxID=108571 RepID=A0ABR4PXC6_9HELO